MSISTAEKESNERVSGFNNNTNKDMNLHAIIQLD
jgi:hypothetical protein